jgi:hypothetical protein
VFEVINAVINITDKTMVIIVKVNVIYDNISEMIGKPMEFEEYQKMVISLLNSFIFKETFRAFKIRKAPLISPRFPAKTTKKQAKNQKSKP